MEDNDAVERIPTNQLRQEEGAYELTTSAQMKPYLDLIKADIQGADCDAELNVIRKLPLEQRYVWRIASALKWGFADFDSVSVEADRKTLTREDFATLTELVSNRPIQFALFLRELFGEEQMQRLMIDAISVAKQVP